MRQHVTTEHGPAPEKNRSKIILVDRHNIILTVIRTALCHPEGQRNALPFGFQNNFRRSAVSPANTSFSPNKAPRQERFILAIIAMARENPVSVG
ncbi:hypothetical protein N7L95_00035 (plasmid) [Eleftheria terrae]|nr:hypothetical protein N7L95_00035 [Eleftheria terrae]